MRKQETKNLLGLLEVQRLAGSNASMCAKLVPASAEEISAPLTSKRLGMARSVPYRISTRAAPIWSIIPETRTHLGHVRWQTLGFPRFTASELALTSGVRRVSVRMRGFSRRSALESGACLYEHESRPPPFPFCLLSQSPARRSASATIPQGGARGAMGEPGGATPVYTSTNFSEILAGTLSAP